MLSNTWLTFRASKYSREKLGERSRASIRSKVTKIPRNQTNKRIYIGREGRSVSLLGQLPTSLTARRPARERESPPHYVTRRSHANVSSSYARRRSHATSVAESTARPKNKSDREGRGSLTGRFTRETARERGKKRGEVESKDDTRIDRGQK